LSEPARRLAARTSGTVYFVMLELATPKRRRAKERQCGWLGLARPSESRQLPEVGCRTPRRAGGQGDKEELPRVEPLNTRVVGLGVILLVLALLLGLYTNQTVLISGQPGAVSAVHENPAQPYLTEALVLAALGVAVVIAGLVMRRRPPSEHDEREGSLGVDESEVRPPGPARPPAP
jgi:hypothetical protein